jgi:hypothetical protein
MEIFFFNFAPRPIAIRPLHFNAIYKTVIGFELINLVLNQLFNF